MDDNWSDRTIYWKGAYLQSVLNRLPEYYVCGVSRPYGRNRVHHVFQHSKFNNRELARSRGANAKELADFHNNGYTRFPPIAAIIQGDLQEAFSRSHNEFNELMGFVEHHLEQPAYVNYHWEFPFFGRVRRDEMNRFKAYVKRIRYAKLELPYHAYVLGDKCARIEERRCRENKDLPQLPPWMWDVIREMTEVIFHSEALKVTNSKQIIVWKPFKWSMFRKVFLQ